MANIIRRIMRTLLRIIGVDLFEDKDQAAALHSVVDDMRARLTQLRTSTAGLVAEQCRIEHALASERDAHGARGIGASRRAVSQRSGKRGNSVFESGHLPSEGN